MARPYNIRVATPGGEAQLGVHSYDACGNLFGLRPDPGTLTFQQLDPGAPAVQSPQSADTYFLYDTLGRIKLHHDQAGFQQAYTYDTLGNATQIGSVAYPVDKSTNRLSMNATYDHRGNITSRLNGTSTEIYRWDLIQLAARNFPSETHLYTVDGERVWTLQQSPAGLKETFTLRDLGGKVLSVFDKTSEVTTWKHDYIHRGSLQLGKATPVATPKDKVHFTLDHLGSTRVVTLDNGKTLETHHFFAYGEEFSGARASDEKLLFTGHERDKNGLGTVDDLDYMHARYYGPQLGRFLSVDPLLPIERTLSNPQGWNRYSYTRGNPLKRVDRDGKLDFVFTVGGKTPESCDAACLETIKKKAYAAQEALRQSLTPAVKAYFQNAFAVDLNKLLQPGAGPTVQVAQGDPSLSGLVGDSNKGRGPLKLNLGFDLFRGKSDLFQAAVVHEAAHYSKEHTPFGIGLRNAILGVPISAQTMDIRRTLLERYPLDVGLKANFDGPVGHTAEILQFGDILTLSLTVDEP